MATLYEVPRGWQFAVRGQLPVRLVVLHSFKPSYWVAPVFEESGFTAAVTDDLDPVLASYLPIFFDSAREARDRDHSHHFVASPVFAW